MEQSFSVKNFRSIYDIDLKNRGDLEREYFEDAYRERLRIRATRRLKYRFLYKYRKGLIRKDHFETSVEKIKKLLEARKGKYNQLVTAGIEKICDKVNRKAYRLPLVKLPEKISGKDVFTIGKSAESVFVTRHLQNILRNTYEVRQSHRDLIVSRLKSICLDASPKYIIKADVKDFYESIGHKALIKKLHSSSRLSVLPKRILTQLLKSYAVLVGCDKGLPRGVGLSAYLSEVYMKEVDEELGNSPDLTFYSRYVDDLIIVFSPNVTIDKVCYLQIVQKVIAEKGLCLNNKTKDIDLTRGQTKEFEYLGYRFSFKGKDVVIRLSEKRVKKYKNRIDRAFGQYFNKFNYNPNKAAELLIDKMRFLTGNARLLNAKRRAFTGVYFNNMYINDVSDLEEIDLYFRSKSIAVTDPRLLKRLTKFSFVKGFRSKIFRSFTTSELKNITRGWKDA
ncbi:antiviral reverse transcriptase Drt3a [Pseudohongiella sp.]|uniref:Reverse transcriptase domain-containing protein n=1 Tax=marine sediment metagenome TaxID=412755 RepID=A0A0F9W6Q9_9ZZZZ|nr:antiviral reverse transcriptase Drt3a [Pseudohongiella sp.]HDZ07862.1 RNA-directed DNA polymerase [Pseudohongiella sp.]